MGRVRISVAMCTYNGACHLQDQLESIASQTLLPDEMIVCDDASVDCTVGILNTFAAKCPFPVRVFSNHATLGTTRNFERAIQLSGGDVIALADQDDIWKPRKLERLLATLEEYPGAGYTFSDAELVDERGVPIGCNLWESLGFRLQVLKSSFRTNQLAILLKCNVVTGAAMVFRASLKRIILPISPLWLHDHWIALLGSSLAYGVPVPECLFMYRQHAAQQLGVRKKTLIRKYEISMAATEDDYRRRLKDFRELQDRILLVAATTKCPAENIKLIGEKVIHLSMRATSQSATGISKVRTVLSEALTGRYQRFSNSWQSIMRDLCPHSILARLDLSTVK